MWPDIEGIDLCTVSLPEVVAHCSRADALRLYERAALNVVTDEVRGGALPDIGVGGGWTLAPLLEISTNDLGNDWAPDMVAASQACCPGVRFERADARELDDVADASINLEVFSGNGISMVGHESRLIIMSEVFRVLKSGGVFVFTTYNRNSPWASADFQFSDVEYSPIPAGLVVRAWRHFRSPALIVAQRR